MRQIQKGIYITPTKKLLYKTSPLKRIYTPNGLTVEKLKEDNPTYKTRILTIYRNLIRLEKYLQFHKFYKLTYNNLVKLKIRQDYEFRKLIFFSNFKQLNENELYERLINTINFIHNATLDSLSNKTERPISIEYKILYSIIKFEISKSLPISIKNSDLKNSFFTIDNAIEFRKIERSWNMINSNDKINNIWWIENNGMYKNDVCFKYLIDLKNFKSSNFPDNMIQSILDFEKFLILQNEESKLLL
ncbi:hypothetical protein C6P40_003932 [Pichia californica]|uniref:Increased recombination centers protein 19 n=1 Tax=Pichia californica TaxID=460514 RepID=A0A9P6WIP7_9ASCO|nr:hypothetical protein C6P42_002638 [[Candida] californica]KAG0686498.1 hypothetical protein C6P40_003932 [[Candida] californica]